MTSGGALVGGRDVVLGKSCSGSRWELTAYQNDATMATRVSMPDGCSIPMDGKGSGFGDAG